MMRKVRPGPGQRPGLCVDCMMRLTGIAAWENAASLFRSGFGIMWVTGIDAWKNAALFFVLDSA